MWKKPCNQPPSPQSRFPLTRCALLRHICPTRSVATTTSFSFRAWAEVRCGVCSSRLISKVSQRVSILHFWSLLNKNEVMRKTAVTVLNLEEALSKNLYSQMQNDYFENWERRRRSERCLALVLLQNRLCLPRCDPSFTCWVAPRLQARHALLHASNDIRGVTPCKLVEV